MLDLGIKGRTAVISGSSRGIGLAAATALAQAGAKVALNYVHNEECAMAALESLLSSGYEAIAVKADVSVEADARRLIHEAESRLGPVDILVNNAHGRISRTFIEDTGWDEHLANLDSILKASLILSQATIGGMKQRGYGRIVNVGNNMTLDPVRGYSALTCAMSSLLGFTRNLAAEAGRWGVTVNMVSPGFVMTDETPHTNEAVRQAIATATPLGRLATPEDIAGVIVFFCSDLGRFVTGAEMSVDGGKVMS